MNDTTGTLGHAIFTGLEKNEYLNEIYDALLLMISSGYFASTI